MLKYSIHLPANANQYLAFSAEFGRINVILGANGTGKSKLLQRLKTQTNSFGEKRSLIYVEGGRTMIIPPSLMLDMQNFNNYKSYDLIEKSYDQKRQQTISQRIKEALLLLEQKEQIINNKFAREAHSWDINGRETPFPQREQPPLERLFDIFNEVFPAITLHFDSSKKTIECLKNGNHYSPVHLSDGEKQVFCLLADIFMLADPRSLILVDEPELNLNPGLACRFWDIIENELPHSIFIYSTHCVSFAMRNHVEKIIVLGVDSENMTFIDNISELNPLELHELLGSIPALLSSSSALAVEGKENSFDQSFYRWILQSTDLAVVPVGSCNDVSSVANKTGIWNKLAPGVKIAGVIDSDYRDDTELENFRKGATSVLCYHEVESYLCDPKLIHEIASKLSVLDVIPTESELSEYIFESFASQINVIAAKRTFAKAKIRLGVSLDKMTLSLVESEQELIDKISDEAMKEVEKANNSIGKDKMIEILNNELKICKEALTEKSLEKILLLMPGKELLNKLAPKAGCKSERNLVNAVKKHINIDDYPKLSMLESTLNNMFN